MIDSAGAGRESPDEALQAWHARAEGRAAVDYGFHLTVTSVPEDTEEAERLFRWFAVQGVTSVKLYLAYPERLMVDPPTLERALVAAKRAGVLVCVHAEDGLDADRRTRQVLAQGRTDPSGLILARPPEGPIERTGRRPVDEPFGSPGSMFVMPSGPSRLGRGRPGVAGRSLGGGGRRTGRAA